MPPYSRQTPQTRLAQVFSEPRIVLAIDYGTTFTGLAWMQTDGERAPQFSDLTLFVDWPGKNEAKVPSEVSYSLTDGETEHREYKQWGYSIDTKNPKGRVLRWTKLELVKATSTVGELEVLRQLIDGLEEINNLHANYDPSADVPLHLSKTTKDIIEFYLGHIAERWVAHVTRDARHALDVVPVDIVVTHPAMWPDEARSILIQAVCGAFNKIILPTRRNIHVMSEPESCALYVVQDVIRNNFQALRVGECLTLCDAGGGTIDLVTYYIANLSPLQLIKIGNVTGASIGATTVDRAFLHWLDSKIQNLEIRPAEYGKGGHYVLLPRVSMLLNKFEVFKRTFTGTESNNLTLPSQAIIRPGEPNSESGQLHISPDDMKAMFKESIDGIKSLIIQQVARSGEEVQQGRRCRVSNIFLAGGFAENAYLFNEVKKTAGRFGDICVRRADDCWTSVVKGAVLGGMAIGAQLPPKIEICPRWYGLSFGGSDLKNGCWTIDPQDENPSLPNELVWLVEKGETIFADSQIKKTIRLCFESRERKQTSTIGFVTTLSDRTPRTLGDLLTGKAATESSIEPLTVRMDRLLPTDFKKCNAKDKKNRSYLLFVEVEMIIKNAATINVRHKNQVIGTHTTTTSPPTMPLHYD